MVVKDVFQVTVPLHANYEYPVDFVFVTDYAKESYIMCSWDFDDGHTQFTTTIQLQLGVSHKYSDPGYYSVLTSCMTTQGLLHHRTQVTIVRDIHWLWCMLTDVSATEQKMYAEGSDIVVHYQHEYTVGLHYSLLINDFEVYRASASVPSTAPDLVEGSFALKTQGLSSIPLGHHNMTLRVMDGLVVLTCQSSFILMSRVRGLKLSMSHSIVVPGDDAVLMLTAESGFPAVIEWKMMKDDSSVVWHKMTERKGKTAQDEEQMIISLSESAQFQVCATVHNNISSETTCINITGQYPVTSVLLSSNSPVNFATTNTVEFSVQFLDSPLPTDVRYSIQFGDGSSDNSTVTGITEVNRILVISHTYATSGIYSVRLHAYNDVSSVMNETIAAVIQPISHLTICLSHYSGIYFPSSERDWFSQEAPFLHPLVAENEYTLELQGIGTIQHVVWTIIGEGLVHQTNTTTGLLVYQFPSNGTFTVQALATNFYSNYTTDEAAVTVLNAIVNLYLISNSPGIAGEPVTFVALVEKLGSNSSFAISYGDGTGEPELQLHRNVNVMKFILENLALPTDPMKSFVAVLNHTYDDTGVYAPRLTGSNPAMDWVAITYVYIEEADHLCWIPVIHIQDGGSSYYEATKYSRNKAFVFGASVTINCLRAKRTQYHWRVYRIESLFTVPSPSNQVALPSNINTWVADMYIPRYTLEYGMYIFQLTVTLVMKDASAANVEIVAHSYTEVISSELVARIRGGSALTVGWYTNITLDASESYDPDETTYRATEDLKYTWYCHPDNESFPNNMTSITDHKLPQTGGCLGTGFLLSPSSIRPSLTIPAGTLQGNQSYHFHLKLSKSSRRDVLAEQTITVLPGHSLSVYISCLLNCGSQLNPSARLVLAGKCPDCTPSMQLEYKWTLQPGHATNAKQTMDWSKDTTTGQHRSYLAVKAGIFSGSSDETYTLRLQIRSQSGATNFAEYTFTTNSPPTVGSCAISPGDGVILQTQFSIVCSGFTDIHTPLTYEVHAVTGAEKSTGVSSLSDTSAEGSLLYYGVEPHIPPTFLPLGLSSQGYRVEIRIKVTDSLGASVSITETTIVRESASTDVESLALELTSNEDSKLNQLMEEGNYQSAAQVMTSVCSVLNQGAWRDGQHGDGEDLEEHQGMLEMKKQKRIEARESMLNLLGQVEVNSLESIQLASSVISQVTSEEDEISPQAQMSTAATILRMSSILKNQADLGGEAVEGAAKFMVSGLSNIMTSANMEQSENTSDSFQAKDQEQLQQTRNVTLTSLHALDDVQTAILLNKVPGEQPTVLQTDALSVILQRQEKKNLDELVLETENSDVVFRLPSGISAAFDQHRESTYDEIIDTQIHHFKQNPFSWSESSDKVTSHVTSLRLGHGTDQTNIAVQTLPQDVEIILTNGDTVWPEVQPLTNQQTGQVFYPFNLTNQEAAMIIKVKFNQSSQLNEGATLRLCLQSVSAPNGTNLKCVMSTTLPKNPADFATHWNSTSNMTFDPYLWVIPPGEVGVYYVTVDGGADLDISEHIIVHGFSTQCLYWNEETEEWIGDGCRVGPLTTLTQTHCLCNHLTSFASSFIVLPNPIDLTDFTLFTTIVDNPITLIAVIVVTVLFVPCAVWAHRRDRLERDKARLIILGDNDLEATYRYHVTVFTGMRRGAGTTAVVALTLQGIVGDSEPHVLMAKDKRNKVLQRNGIDSFLLTTKESLGILRAVRVWHDNSGSSPEWYLSRILVHDMEKDRWWYFLCHTWLGIDLGDCQIDRTFPVANSDDLKDFHHMFFTRSAKDMMDNHLWVSVFSMSPRSTFTRLQRAACCFSLLLMSMLVSIMFYQVDEGDEAGDVYNFGVLSISVKTIIIACESSLLAFPISLGMVQFFREIRPRESDFEIIQEGSAGEDQDVTDELQDGEFKTTKLPADGDRTSPKSNRAESQPSSESTHGENSPEETSRRNKAEQSVTRESTAHPSHDSNPERDCFNNDKDYEEYMDKYTEFVSLRSSCKNKIPYVDEAVSNRSCEINTWIRNSAVAVTSTRQLTEQEFRPDLLPECDQALLRGRMNEVPRTANWNSNSSSDESTLEVRSGQSNVNSHNTGSIQILIPPGDAQSNSTSDAVIYKTYEDFLSSRLNVLYEQLHNPPPRLFKTEEDRRRALRKLKLALAMHGWEETKDDESKSSSSETQPEQKDEVQKLFTVQGHLPWWCIYIAWFLLISSSLFAAYLIILYGLTFGRQKSIDWLVAIFMEVFQNVVVIQPVKVVLIACFFAVVIKSFQPDDIGVEFFRQLKPYTDRWQSTMTTTQANSALYTSHQRCTHYYFPLTDAAVRTAREKRQAEGRMYSLIKSFLGQVIFIWLALQVSNAQREPGSIYLSETMKKIFIESANKVQIMPDVYSWIKDDFTVSLYGDEPGAVLQDSVLVGSPRLRQLRVKPEHCTKTKGYHGLWPDCQNIPGTEADEGSYGELWTLTFNDSHSNQSLSPWVYQSWRDAKGSFFVTDPGRYSRGGFIADLGMTPDAAINHTIHLQNTRWVDQYTQALIIEWVMYNANVNLFCVSTVVFRAEGTMGVVLSYEFAIVRIYRYTSPYDRFVVTLEVIYILVVVVVAYIEFFKWKSERRHYWDLWNSLNVAIILLSLLATAAYIWKLVLAIQTMALYRADRTKHRSFADIVLLDFILMASLGGVVFCSILKCLKILLYNDSMFLLQKTLKSLSTTILFYISMLTVTLFAFAFFAHVSFGRHIQYFSSLLWSFESVFALVLRRYNAIHEVTKAFGTQAYLFLGLVNFFLVAIVVNIFVAMLLDAYATAKQRFVKDKDHNMVSLLVDSFFSAFSIKGRKLNRHNSIVSEDKVSSEC